ncbi:MAG: hypothetical protein IKW38_02125 [Kiritimatiellae bacterium]|nr:hypothetical protein [Kiritimatiellia bacterium]
MASHLHFQTAFSVKPTGVHSARELFSKLQTVIFNWVCQKQNKHGYKQIDIDAFKKKLEVQGFVNGAKLKTVSCFMDDEISWAMRFEELDTSDASRPWTTEVGMYLSDENGAVNFSYTTYYRTSVAEEFEKPIKPTYKFPHLIKLILEIPGTQVYFSGGLPLTSSYTKIRTSQEALNFISAANDGNREDSLVLVMGASRENEMRARNLAQTLYGKVCVFLADRTPEVLETFCNKKHTFNLGQIRIYYPRKSRGSKDYSKDKLNELDNAIAQLLKIPAIKTPTSVRTLSDVMHRRLFIKLTGLNEFFNKLKKAAQSELKREEVDMDFINLVQETNEELQKENEKLRNEIETIEAVAESEMKELRDVFAKKEAEYLAQIRSQKKTPSLPREFPAKLTDVLAWAKLLPNLMIAQSAHASAKKYEQFKEFSVAWDMLLALNSVLFRLKFTENKSNFWTEFQDRTGYEFAKGEGPKTNSDTALVKLRQFQHNGKSYEGWMHLKYGNQPNKLLRIHFDFDEELRKIVVLHVGDHIPNATTGKL